MNKLNYKYIFTKNNNIFVGHYLENNNFLTTFGFIIFPDEIKKEITYEEYQKIINK